jgi:ABC-type glutathione transport system ATPase component
MSLLKVSGISKKGAGDFLLEGINFSQVRHQKIAIAGETGAGKSTLLKIIAGLVQPDSGEVIFENENVKGPDETLVPGHPRIAYLSQHFELQKFLRVEQVLTYSNSISETDAQTLYEVCRIAHLLKRKTDQLSGGEKQRIAICRLLTAAPRLLLLDEPFSHLDIVHKSILKTVIRDIGEKLKITCMLVSHDPTDTLSWADQVLAMKDGKLVQKGTPEIVYAQPANEYVGGLFGNYNVIPKKSLKAFSVLPAIKRSIAFAGEKDLFIRPEHFKLVTKKSKSLKGKVQKVSFLGSYYELEVAILKKIFLIKTEKRNFKDGDRVNVSIYPGRIWYV